MAQRAAGRHLRRTSRTPRRDKEKAMTLRSTLTLTGALLGASVVMAPLASAADVPDSRVQRTDPMTSFVMQRDGKTSAQGQELPGGEGAQAVLPSVPRRRRG
uniref:Uncharacterized protein n=1 Tax=Janibacter limosus TaxID=53458 RepID=A0AC61U3H4_9MICO|nr:hypothetical protein [Janibacter limosus]